MGEEMAGEITRFLCMTAGAFIGCGLVRAIWPERWVAEIADLRREFASLRADVDAVREHAGCVGDARIRELVRDYGERITALQSQVAEALFETRSLRRELGGTAQDGAKEDGE